MLPKYCFGIIGVFPDSQWMLDLDKRHKYDQD